MKRAVRVSLLVVVVSLAIAPVAAPAGVRGGQPFPSNLYTVSDPAQLTGLRVALKQPDCGAQLSACEDIGVLNTLDGFNVDARISIPFSGPIDLSTVTHQTVYLVDVSGRRGAKRPKHFALDRLVWTAATNTLHGNPTIYLDEHTPYVLVVTDRVKAAGGGELDKKAFRASLAKNGYGRALAAALKRARVPADKVVDASLFTTQSVSATLEQIRKQLDATKPAPATFALGPAGTPTVFPYDSVLGITITRQTSTAGFTSSTIPPAINVAPGAIGTVAFGKYSSPNYETELGVIPSYPTRTGKPLALSTNDIYFNLYLPSGTAPAGGWPVEIFGHGFTDSKQGAPITVASTMAKNGIATIAINVVGHGGGPLGTLTVLRNGAAPVTFPAGGRGVDANKDGKIDSTEGSSATGPSALINNRDGLRQTTVDLMQLVREIKAGMDVNGDGKPDLDASKIFYAGQSFGGIYGSIFMAVEPNVHAGVLNVPGGSVTEIARLSPAFRPLTGIRLLSRSPSLFNATPNSTATNFLENMPLSNQPVLVDTQTGADAIQEFLDRAIWAAAAGDPVAYAVHIRAEPLSGVKAKAIIVQFAKGDQTVPNPTTTALIRAGRLKNAATFFRNDLAFAAVPGYATKNPHTFLTAVTNPTQAGIAVAAQQQIATFFTSGGTSMIDPDGAAPLFEAPIVGPLPQELNYLP